MPPQSDTDEEKTEDPTPRRREEAREEGNVPRSQDLSGAFVLLAAVLFFAFWGEWFVDRLLSRIRWIYGQAMLTEGDPDTIILLLKDMNLFIMELLFPLLVGVFVFGLLGTIVQFGFIWAPGVMSPDFSQMNPIQGLQRIFSLKGLVRLLMSLGKVAVISAVLWFTLNDELGIMLGLISMSVEEIARYMADTTLMLAVRFVLALIVLSLLDFAYQKWQHEQDLKMTKKEVEEETKRMEGDPEIQKRMKEIQKDMAEQRMMSDVPEADVVVTNPTEYAVALTYETEVMAAPKVVAKGKDQIADNIRKVASEHHVPIVERPPLARALFQTTEIGEEIPEDLFEAVAEVLAYVHQLQNNPGFTPV